jgi:hypothetical protein
MTKVLEHILDGTRIADDYVSTSSEWVRLRLIETERHVQRSLSFEMQWVQDAVVSVMEREVFQLECVFRGRLPSELS